MNWTFGTEEIPLRVLPSGHTLTAPVFRLVGEGNKKTYIQANNHGGEIAGNGAIFSLVRKLQSYDIYGTIIIVPHCNPVSLNTQVDDAQIGVYDALTGHNWNRLFQLLVSKEPQPWQVDLPDFVHRHRNDPWDKMKKKYRVELALALSRLQTEASVRGLKYALRFALQLQSLSCDADYVLDLHTGDTAPHYLYAPEYTHESARYFKIQRVLEMGNVFEGAFDEAHFCPWMMLVAELNEQGRRDIQLDVEAYTVELGSLLKIIPEQMDQDAERILNYLKHKKMISGEAEVPKDTIYCSKMRDYVSYQAPASGLAVITLEPGVMVKRGDQIGYILTMRNLKNIHRPEQAQTPIHVREDGILITRRLSPIVSEGQVLFKLMTNWRVL